MAHVGQQFTSTEHLPETVGTVFEVCPNGALKIEWVTPPSATLPYGVINLEYWPVEDQHLLIAVLGE